MSTRALLVSPLARTGGAERAFVRLVHELPRHGVDPVVALLEHGRLERWLDDAVVIDARPLERLRPLRKLSAVERLRRLARAAGAGVVVSSKTRGHVFGGPAARAAGVPAVWWRHEVPAAARLVGRGHPGSMSRAEAVARRVPADCVVCGNEHAAGAQRAIDPRTPVATIRAGIPVRDVAARRGSGAAVRAELGWERSPLVGMVGRLSPEKGQDLFLRAAAAVAAARPDVRFVVVGGSLLDVDAGFASRLPGLAAELGLGDRVRFTGHRDDPLEWIDALDVLAVASRAETGPLVVGEAMALGTPTVAVRAPGLDEVVDDGRSGLLVDPDAPALAAGILRVLDDGGLAAALSAGAEERAEMFCDRAMGERFAAVLSDVAA